MGTSAHIENIQLNSVDAAADTPTSSKSTDYNKFSNNCVACDDAHIMDCINADISDTAYEQLDITYDELNTAYDGFTNSNNSSNINSDEYSEPYEMPPIQCLFDVVMCPTVSQLVENAPAHPLSHPADAEQPALPQFICAPRPAFPHPSDKQRPDNQRPALPDNQRPALLRPSDNQRPALPDNQLPALPLHSDTQRPATPIAANTQHHLSSPNNSDHYLAAEDSHQEFATSSQNGSGSRRSRRYLVLLPEITNKSARTVCSPLSLKI